MAVLFVILGEFLLRKNSAFSSCLLRYASLIALQSFAMPKVVFCNKS
jgi:hypothetical protein